jgi:hypothetical protein
MFLNPGTEMATGSENTHTPWAQIGLNPFNYFDTACIPEGFQIQDPSRMGLSVKELLNHLRQRQEDLGVNAFHFHHILKNQKLEPAEYPPEAMKVIKGTANIQIENGHDQQSPKKAPKSQKSAPRPSPLPKGSSNTMPEVKSCQMQVDRLEDPGINVQLTGTSNEDAKIKFESLRRLPSDSNAIDKPNSSGSTAEPAPRHHPEKPTFTKHLELEAESSTKNQNGAQHYDRGPVAFNFPADPMYQAYGQHPSHPAFYHHPMPIMKGPSVQSWPILQGPNLTQQAESYLGPPHSMGPMVNLYHPQYGLQQIPGHGHLNYMQSGPYQQAIDPHLQLPPGDPIFSLPNTGDVREDPQPKMSNPEGPTRVIIQPPAYTPGKSTSLKNSPQKRKRVDDTDDIPITPTRRSGRATRTPKKLQQD